MTKLLTLILRLYASWKLIEFYKYQKYILSLPYLILLYTYIALLLLDFVNNKKIIRSDL